MLGRQRQQVIRVLKNFIAGCIASLTNWGLVKLRNGVDWRLSREEIRFSHISFSQFGEDEAILAFTEEDPTIPHIYVDVGCFHPIHHSNTLLLHKRGWRGVNVDLQESKIALFRKLRPNDINIVAACSNAEQDMLALIYGGGVTDRLATVDQPSLLSVVGDIPQGSTPIRTITLNHILKTHDIGRIGYLNIDCEGHDFEVLKGLDLVRYAPAIIGIETMPENDSEIAQHLDRFGYFCRRTYYRTSLYVKRP